MVHAAITHIQLVHHIHHTHDNLWIVRGIAIYFDVEDVSTTRHLVIGRLDFSLVARTTFIIDRHVVRIGVVVAIRHARNHAKLLAVLLCELTAQALGRCCQYGIVMMVALAEFIDALTHIAHNLQAQLLSLVALAMMLACKCHQTFGQSNEAYT